jgi:membrane-associated phospholipid phosphatase
LAETLAATLVVQQATQLAVRRPRPYCYAQDGGPPGRDRRVSFFSGHTATAFAAAFATGTLATSHDGRDGVRAAVWATGGAGAGAIAVLRVSAGKHFPTDVMTGALIGSALGVGIPLLHGAPAPEAKDLAFGAVGVAVGAGLFAIVHFRNDEPGPTPTHTSLRIVPVPFGVVGTF